MRKITMLVIAAFAVTSAAAQFNPQQPIPADKDVPRASSNGMTYYIRHNEKPKDRPTSTFCTTSAPFRERFPAGLAHFLEHMAFNGTKNLPGKMLTGYLEK
ncbi:MAG: insulinase family protein [Alistipes finegoldii]